MTWEEETTRITIQILPPKPISIVWENDESANLLSNIQGIRHNKKVTRAFYVKYLRRTLASVTRDEARYRQSTEAGFGTLAEHLTKVAQQTQQELDRVLEEPDGGDYSPDLLEFNERVIYPKTT